MSDTTWTAPTLRPPGSPPDPEPVPEAPWTKDDLAARWRLATPGERLHLLHREDALALVDAWLRGCE